MEEENEGKIRNNLSKSQTSGEEREQPTRNKGSEVCGCVPPEETSSVEVASSFASDWSNGLLFQIKEDDVIESTPINQRFGVMFALDR